MILKLRFSGGGSLFARHLNIVVASCSFRRLDTLVVGMALIPDIMVSTSKDAISIARCC